MGIIGGYGGARPLAAVKVLRTIRPDNAANQLSLGFQIATANNCKPDVSIWQNLPLALLSG
jgi:hypothetical protein